MELKEDITLCNYTHDHRMRSLSISQVEYPVTVYYHADEGRWFASHGNDDQQIIVTKTGKIKLADIPIKKNVIHFSSPCLEDKNEVLVLKDESGYFGVFTMSPHGYYYGSDRDGFVYKSVHLFFDSWTRPLESSVHYLTTENNEGKWDLVWLSCPQHYDRKHRIQRYNFGIVRKWLIKGCLSEKEALDYLKSIGGPGFEDTRRFITYDLTDSDSQSTRKGLCDIDGQLLTVSAFFSLDESNSYQHLTVTMWPTNQLRTAFKVNDNEALMEEINRECTTDADNDKPVLGFQEKLKKIAKSHGIRYRINILEESRD